MAITVSSDASRFTRTANIPARTSYSMFGWFRLTTDRNNFTGLLAIASQADGGSYNYIETDSNGTSLILWTEATNTPMFSASLNTWYFLAMTRGGDGAGAVNAYWRAVTDNALSSTSMSHTGTWTPALMVFGGANWTGEFLNGQMHAIGACDAQLSADELLALSYFHEPQKQGIRSLNVFYPCIEAVNTSAVVDRSGNGRNASSTVGALADSPPLLWTPAPSALVLPTAGGGGSVIDDSVSETGSAADSLGSILTAVASLAETGSATDAASSSLTTPQAIAETGSATDAVASALVAVAAIAETGAATDLVSVIATLLVAIAESASAADAINGTTGAGTYNVSISEAGSAVDALSALMIRPAAIAEAGAAGDALSAQLSAVAIVSEGLAAADSVSSVATMLAQLLEAGAAVDLVFTDSTFVPVAKRKLIAAAVNSVVKAGGVTVVIAKPARRTVH